MGGVIDENGNIFGLNPKTFGLLGAGLGGILGGLSGSGDTQGSQGYTGGIPDLTASRTLVPGVFGSTYTTPTGELAPRTPGSSGRRYFSDVAYTPVTDAAGRPTIMGAAQFEAANQAASDSQQELTDLGKELLGIYGQNQASQATTGGATTDFTLGGSGYVNNTVGPGFGEVVSSADTVLQNELNNYLQTLGYGLEAKTVTAADIQSAVGAGYSLADVASAFGTTPDILNQVLDPTSTTTTSFIDPTNTFTAGDATSDIVNTVFQNDLNSYLQGLGYGLEPKTVTAADIQSAVGAGYSLENIAGAFGTTPDILNQVLNATSTTTTAAIDPTSTFTAGDASSNTVNTVFQNDLNSYLQGLGYGLEPKTVTAADIQSAVGAGYSLADIAGAFGTTENILNNILDPTTTVTTSLDPTSTYTAGDSTTSSETTIPDTAINNYLQTLGYGLEAKTVTAEDIQSAVGEGYSLADIAGAFSTTEARLNSILDPTTTTTSGTAGSSTYTKGTETTSTVAIENAVRDYLTGSRGFTVGTEKEVTQEDLKALKDSGFTVEQIATGLNASVDDINALLSYEFAAGGQVLDAVDLATGGMAQGQGYYLGGATDGMSDQIPATIDNMQPAALSDGEFVIPADVVSHLGNGNSDAGAQNLYSMMERVRTDRTGNPNQGNQIDPNQYLA